MYLLAKLKKCISLKNYVGHKIEILVGGYNRQVIKQADFYTNDFVYWYFILSQQ